MADQELAPNELSTKTGMDFRLAGLLCYVLGWISGLIFYVIEKDNKFVRFHAMQSILLSVGWFVIYIGIFIITSIAGAVPYLGFIFNVIMGLVNLVIGLGAFVLWIFMMVKAYNGEKYKLPLIGDMAEKNA
ncbi:MAG: DUF4870 domain-containing protein [Actinobacteria bacterium]|nr:DUF4870 domain-containing protein [Actinomycetota bacterium]